MEGESSLGAAGEASTRSHFLHHILIVLSTRQLILGTGLEGQSWGASGLLSQDTEAHDDCVHLPPRGGTPSRWGNCLSSLFPDTMKPLRDASLSWTTLAAAPRAIWIGHTDPVSRSFPELSRGLGTRHQEGTVLREESSQGSVRRLERA